MTQNMGLISKLATIALVIGVARAAEPGSLEKFVQTFQSVRSGMRAESRRVAELFASSVGSNRFYRYKMKLTPAIYPKAQLEPVEKFIRSMQKLEQWGDADAIVETITRVAPLVSEQELSNEERVPKLVEAIIKPACREYNFELFDSDEFTQARQNGQLQLEVDTHGAEQSVKDFLFGWAHYHACKLLLNENNSVLYHRVAFHASTYLKNKKSRAAKAGL